MYTSFRVLLISLLRWKIENISTEYLLFEVKIRAAFDNPPPKTSSVIISQYY